MIGGFELRLELERYDDDEVDWGYGENPGVDFSRSRIEFRAVVLSQGGGRMLARFWRTRRRASQRGRLLRWGGRRGGMGPC